MASDLYRDCARLLMVGFPGKGVDFELQKLSDDGIFGAVLFRRNIGDAAQTAELCRSLKTHAKRPFLLSVDQEGGRVARLKGAPFAPLPPMRSIGATGDLSLAERAGRLLGFELSALGFDWDFAPVLDVDTNPQNPVIGDRSFSRDPQEVARFGLALSRGLETSGIASCGKHFPGHGDTAQDSHADLPYLPHDLARLESVELVPFAEYARAQLASVMTAHVVFPAMEKELPATLSPRMIQGLLRDKLHFDGVVVSDDLEMKAIADHWSVPEAAVQSIAAGSDLLLICHTVALQRAAIEALVKAVESKRISRQRLAEAHRRLDRLQERFFHPAADRLATLGSSEHRALSSGFEIQVAGVDPTEYV